MNICFWSLKQDCVLRHWWVWQVLSFGCSWVAAPLPGARTRAEPPHPGFSEPLPESSQLRRLGPVHCAPDKWRMSSICSVWPWLITDNRRSCPRLYQALRPQSPPATSPASAELPFENFITGNNACSLWGLRVRFSHALSHHMLTNNLYSYWALSPHFWTNYFKAGWKSFLRISYQNDLAKMWK